MKKIVIAILVVSLMLIGCGNSTEHEGKVKTPSGSDIMKGQNYEKVVEEFEEEGFKNIKTERIEDLITGWLTDDGEVEKVSVGGDVDYYPDEWVDENVEVIIYYHTFPVKKEDMKETENNNSKVEKSFVEVEQDTSFMQEPIEQEDKDSDVIIMDKSSEDYVAEKWNVEVLKEHLQEMGFQNIQLKEKLTSDKDKINLVAEVHVDGYDCYKGMEYDPTDAIRICYYVPDVLNVDNCPELAMVLTSREMDYLKFAEKYDGRTFEFNAKIYDRVIAYGEDVITVKGEDAEGNTGLGYNVHIRDYLFTTEKDDTVQVDDEVYVKGVIDKSWCEFYHTICVQIDVLRKR